MQTLNGINIFNPEIFSFGAAASSMPIEKEINPVPVQPQRMSQNCPADDLDFEDEDDFEEEDEYDENDFEEEDEYDEDDFEEEDEYDEDDFEDDDQIV